MMHDCVTHIVCPVGDILRVIIQQNLAILRHVDDILKKHGTAHVNINLILGLYLM